MTSHASGNGARNATHAGDLGTLDETNRRILHLLAQHGRSTMRDIAEVVGRNESSVRDRVALLELRGLVKGYEARIDWALAGLPLLVMVDAYCPPGQSSNVARQLHRVPNLGQAVVTTGSPNMWASVFARDIQEVRRLLDLLSSTPLQDVRARVTVERLVAERQPMASVAAAPAEALSSAPFMGPMAHPRGHGLHHDRLAEEPAHERAQA